MNNSLIDSFAVDNRYTELVRGQDQEFLSQLKPRVHRESVCLDFSSVQRVDAAGLAALITLHCDARQAGHQFSIVNPTHHVIEILSLVGLDKILVSEAGDAVRPEFQASAA